VRGKHSLFIDNVVIDIGEEVPLHSSNTIITKCDSFRPKQPLELAEILFARHGIADKRSYY